MNGAAIETVGLGKVYAVNGDTPVHAVHDVNLAIKQGEIYALLGPNGAGKTTTISILTTLLLPTEGTASVAGYDVVKEAAQVRRRIGVTFQEIVVDAELSGRQVLDFHGHLYGLDRTTRKERIRGLAALVELTDVLDRKVETYSGGMKRRLELARGLMTSPSVLFLDEPTQGLDPQNRAGIWRYVRRLREEHGITLLLTTHYMEEAETLADRVGIIDGGRLVVEGSPKALVRAMGADVVSLLGTGVGADFSAQLEQQAYVSAVTSHVRDEQTLLQIGVDNGDKRLPELVQMAVGDKIQVHEISVTRPSLADVFLAHTGHNLRNDA